MNMENNSYIKIYRSLLDWEWAKDPYTFRLFFEILLRCSWKETRFKGKILPPGTLITSHELLADFTGMTRTTVKKILGKLEETGEIKVQSIRKIGSTINVCNWSKYQFGEDNTSTITSTITSTDTSTITSTDTSTITSTRLPSKKKKEIKKKINKHIPLAEAADDVQNSIFSFSEPEQVSAVQMMDSLARWERLTKVWVTQESLVVLKTVRDKYFLKLPPSVQEEVVQYVESLSGFQSKYLTNLWIGPLLKSNNFSVEHIRLEIEQKEKYDRTRPKSYKEQWSDEDHFNHNYDENGREKNPKYSYTGPINKN